MEISMNYGYMCSSISIEPRWNGQPKFTVTTRSNLQVILSRCMQFLILQVSKLDYIYNILVNLLALYFMHYDSYLTSVRACCIGIDTTGDTLN